MTRVTKEQTRRLNALLLVGVLLTFASVAHSERTNTPKERHFFMAVPGEECRVPPPSQWTESEKSAWIQPPEWTEPEEWAWKEICEGRIANFNKRLNEELDPRNPDHDDRWSDNRRLSSRFLETILLHEPFRSAIPRQGVLVEGAYFPDSLDLKGASIERILELRASLFKSKVLLSYLTTPLLISLDGSKFDGLIEMHSVSIGSHLFMNEATFSAVDLRVSKIGRRLTMVGSIFEGELNMDGTSVGDDLFMREAVFKKYVRLRGMKSIDQVDTHHSTFEGELNMDGISVGGALFMREAVFKKYVRLTEANIGGQLSVSGSIFEGTLNMNSISVNDLLLMSKAKFSEVLLIAANIGSQLGIDGSTFESTLDMNSASIENHLFIIQSTFKKDVDLGEAQIGGQLGIEGSTFEGTLNIESASVSSHLFMRESTFSNPANLKFVSTGSNLDTRGITLRGLDLTGSRIEGELRLGSSDANIEWKSYTDENGDCQAPKLTLRNVSVSAIQDTTDTWPDHLEREFEGFTYDRLGEFDASEQEKPDERESSWFIEWLAKDKSYSPQPYRHLADVFRATGHEDMADDILFASRNREFEESEPLQFKWWRLLMLKLFIGYGYGWRVFWALAWVAGLAVLGTAILHMAKENNRRSMKLGFLYSLDMLLPIIHLRELHYTDVDLNTWARRYFYFHKIMGYVLIFFVLAGLSGLTEE